jgi:hypothetical protein
VEYALRSQPLARQEEAGRKAGAAAFVLVGPAAEPHATLVARSLGVIVPPDGRPSAERRYTVRRPGQDDLFFDNLDALAAWASAPSPPAP